MKVPANSMSTASSVLADRGRSRHSMPSQSLDGHIAPGYPTPPPPQTMHPTSQIAPTAVPETKSIPPTSTATEKMGTPIDVPQPASSTSFSQGPFNNPPFDRRNASFSVPGPMAIPAMQSAGPRPGSQGHELSMSLNSSGANFCSHVTNAQSHARRSSEGAHASLHGFREGGRRLANEMRCEHCGKGYKHSSCLTKHMWEHNPAWSYTSKLAMSKHQQVQMLEAASVLVSMNPPNFSLTPPHSAGPMPTEQLQSMSTLESTPATSCPTDVKLPRNHAKDIANNSSLGKSPYQFPTRNEPASGRSSKSPAASRSANTSSPSPSSSLDESMELHSTKSNVPPFSDFNYTAAPESLMRASHPHIHSHSLSNSSNAQFNAYREHAASVHNSHVHSLRSPTGTSTDTGVQKSDTSNNHATADSGKVRRNGAGAGDTPTLSTLIQSYNSETGSKPLDSKRSGSEQGNHGISAQNLEPHEENANFSGNASGNAFSSSVTSRPAFSVPSYSAFSQPTSFTLPGLSYNISDVREMRSDLKENRQSVKGKPPVHARHGVHEEHDHFNDVHGDEEEDFEDDDAFEVTNGVAISNSESSSVTRDNMRRKYSARREAREKMKLRRKQHVTRPGHIKGRRFTGSGSFPAYSHVDTMSMPSEQFFARQTPSSSTLTPPTSKTSAPPRNADLSLSVMTPGHEEDMETEQTPVGLDEDASMDDFDGVFGKMEE